MTKLRYLEKRDERGVVLYYSAHELAYEVTHKAIDVINASKMIGRQLILSDERYSTKHFLLNANAQTVESE